MWGLISSSATPQSSHVWMPVKSGFMKDKNVCSASVIAAEAETLAFLEEAAAAPGEVPELPAGPLAALGAGAAEPASLRLLPATLAAFILDQTAVSK